MAASAVSLVAVLLLAAFHIAARRIRRRVARPAWLSVASGVAIAYVFVHMMPQLAEAEARWIDAQPYRPFSWLQSQIYVAALVGLVVALGLERETARRPAREAYVLHISAFAVYNFLIGAFALRATTVATVVLATIAFAAHFVVTDQNLRERHRRAYDERGRWILAAALVLGSVTGVVWQPPIELTAALLALLAGVIVANLTPRELVFGQARFGHFAAGTGAYAAFLLAFGYRVHTG